MDKLFSITKKDFEMQVFRSGGKGGQNQNKVSSGVRFIHKDSGARGEARDSRDQLENKKQAFLRLVKTPVFQTWLKIEIAKRTGQLAAIEAEVDRTLYDVVVEVKDDEGRWSNWLH